ncbi:MAG TPA: glutathione S-transferase family protein [Solimonas sp.]|nr:glutathione S-transferase family protein [Solimonas sp.]
MAEIILHHYPVSPYSEKIRAILGYKNLAWRSVIIPIVMPKPELLPLTGGYRKTPALQIGADIWCDSKLIARVLERLQPAPTLLPTGREATCVMQEQWSEKFFLLSVPLVVMQPAGQKHVFRDYPEVPPEKFLKDRAALFTGGSQGRASAGATRAEMPGLLALLEAQLASAPFIDGEAPTMSDFALYHPVWFLLSNPGVAAYYDPYPRIREWAGRMASFGHGRPEPLGGAEALRIAAAATPQPVGGSVDAAEGFRAGERVVVAATDYGVDPVEGELLRADAQEIAIRRQDPQAGELVVHFPRAGFRLARKEAG